MSNTSSNDTIDDVTPGDVIAVRGGKEQPAKVVHKQADDAGTYLVTFEKDNGETFETRLPAGTPVTRSLEAKWESAQSPTPNNPPS